MQALEDDCEGLDKRISAQDEAQEMVLGLWWLPGQDLLTFVVKPNLLAKASKERPTKRRVLSVVMSIFDPLGLLGFFNIRAKIILQNIWRSNIGWDDDLTKEDEVDWRHWLDLVSKLNTVRIPRCMKCILPDLQHFSKLEKLRAAQLCVLDFLRIVTKKTKLDGRLELQKMLLLKRSKDMDVIFIRICQEEEFYSEITSLKSGRRLNDRKSLLFKLSPYIDDSGILRIKGRIDNIEGVEVCVKRPIILPRRHRLTYLLFEFYHRKYHHVHNEIVVNELRQQYWVCSLRALVKEVSSACPACRIRRARPKPPEMSDLPIERLSPYTPPFTYTGVDYFGPYDIVVGRHREKRWGVLFTCLTVRAVHLDIATSLSTDSYLCVLKSFVAGRGCPRRMLSDNGTNFRGASRILKDEIERISPVLMERQYPELEFTFIPPGSPHMGGSWERLVRSTKSILSEILPHSGLREEVLRAALADVESMLNSRPLTYVPLETSESEALTPNHFLIGHSSGLRERGSRDRDGASLARGFRVASQLADQFWKDG
ncbi:uncharacterized protein LOC135439572 [Drosophila montana]|uniref:uncharacterized protein LOC135439572 n=1 Tax=Drosophila montana TaxID=40370 RepID=UPI00313E6639